MNAEEIGQQITRTMERLRLNRGSQAHYDDLGRRELLDAFHHASRIRDQHGMAD